METIFACATGERRKLIQAWFGRVKSSVYRPEPATQALVLDAPDFAPAAKACWRRSRGRSVRHVFTSALRR